METGSSKKKKKNEDVLHVYVSYTERFTPDVTANKSFIQIKAETSVPSFLIFLYCGTVQ